jgi:predicted GIY-YIG superfamily endonuclease
LRGPPWGRGNPGLSPQQQFQQQQPHQSAAQPRRTAHVGKDHSRGFASQHGCKLLVYFDLHADMLTAIAREKPIKHGSRARKIALIENRNGAWRDLYPEIMTG